MFLFNNIVRKIHGQSAFIPPSSCTVYGGTSLRLDLELSKPSAGHSLTMKGEKYAHNFHMVDFIAISHKGHWDNKSELVLCTMTGVFICFCIFFPYSPLTGLNYYCCCYYFYCCNNQDKDPLMLTTMQTKQKDSSSPKSSQIQNDRYKHVEEYKETMKQHWSALQALVKHTN